MPGVYSLRIPRHACTPRDTARAGDLWRLVQDAAVHDAADRGWPPERFRTLGTGFVVREMRALHLREAAYGENLSVTTQIADHRREVLMRRETQIEGVMHATADWVHIGREGGPARAAPELIAAFPIDLGAPVVPPLSESEETGAGESGGGRDGPGVALPAFSFSPWWTEMDPLGHTNHPRYVDWADETLARALHVAGLDPIGVVPLADRVRFRLGARATDRVVISGTVRLRQPVHGAPALECRLRARRASGVPGDGAEGEAPGDVIADLVIVRGHLNARTPAALIGALGA